MGDTGWDPPGRVYVPRGAALRYRVSGPVRTYCTTGEIPSRVAPPAPTSCPGCGAPPEGADGCSYCGRGRVAARVVPALERDRRTYDFDPGPPIRDNY